MRLRPPLRVSVTRHGDKEQKLKDFIVQHMLADTEDHARFGEIQVVARSLESPVVKAIVSLSREISDAGVSVRMILAQADSDALADGWTDAGQALGFQYDIRCARRPRLIEAHEQMVLGPHACWIGDSMRRDPAKCDAFESYVEGCGEAAGCALVSFERLWVASEPVLVRAPRPVVVPEDVEVPAAAETMAKPEAVETIAATRH